MLLCKTEIADQTTEHKTLSQFRGYQEMGCYMRRAGQGHRASSSINICSSVWGKTGALPEPYKVTSNRLLVCMFLTKISDNESEDLRYFWLSKESQTDWYPWSLTNLVYCNNQLVYLVICVICRINYICQRGNLLQKVLVTFTFIGTFLFVVLLLI